MGAKEHEKCMSARMHGRVLPYVAFLSSTLDGPTLLVAPLCSY
jgi:hypothetical protein